jgi:hypothetical protein
MSTRHLPARPNLEHYKKQAKDLLKRYKADDPEALRRFQAHRPHVAQVTLAAAQFAIAREHSFDSWPKFVKQIATLTGGDPFMAIWKSAEEAVVAGNVPTLERLLREHSRCFVPSGRNRPGWAA